VIIGYNARGWMNSAIQYSGSETAYNKFVNAYNLTERNRPDAIIMVETNQKPKDTLNLYHDSKHNKIFNTVKIGESTNCKGTAIFTDTNYNLHQYTEFFNTPHQIFGKAQHTNKDNNSFQILLAGFHLQIGILNRCIDSKAFYRIIKTVCSKAYIMTSKILNTIKGPVAQPKPNLQNSSNVIDEIQFSNDPAEI
jgi:hypothetical protein